jgi:multidrug efflux pump subunit AcrA (membrane-fusion protein)
MEYTVQTWTLENALTLQWTTQFADSQKLTFMTQWKVTAVNVKVWDYVKKGQVLAKISTDDLDNNVAQAQLDIDTQRANLQDLLEAKNIELEYIQEKANYDALLLQKETINQDQELAMQELQQKIKDAQKTYNDTLADYQELLSWSNSANADLALSSTIRKRNQTLETAVLELKTIINDVNSVLDNYDKKLIITDKYKYEVAKNDYIWADNLSLKVQSEKWYNQINKDLSNLREKYNTLNSKSVSDLTSEEVLDAYSALKVLWNNLINRWETNYNMFKASITSSSYNLSDIENDAKTFGTDLQSLWVKYVQLYTTKVSTLADLDDDTSLEDTKLKLDKAKTNLDKLNLQVDVLKAQQEKDKATLEDNIDTAIRNLNKIAWWESLKETQITQAQNRLKQLQRNMRNIMDKYDDYELTANFDGVITEMDIQVWDSINPASTNTNPKYIYVESNNILEMTFDVEQIDIIQLKVWMDAEIYLDAYPNEIYYWKISEINTIPNTSSMTTTYTMTVIFEKNDPNQTILAGMWGSAKIILNKIEDVLIIPSQAITTISGQNMVMLKKWEQWVEQPVEIWDSDESNTEIVSWLKSGDIIKSMFYSIEW